MGLGKSQTMITTGHFPRLRGPTIIKRSEFLYLIVISCPHGKFKYLIHYTLAESETESENESDND
jgi:hypothetical protein